MKKILFFVFLLIVSVNMADAQLTPHDLKKKRQIAYALKNRIISPFDVSAEKYFKYGLNNELKKTLDSIKRSSGAYVHARLKGHENSVESVYISNGKIVSGSNDNTIKIWDLESGTLINTLTNHSNDVNSVFVSDNKIVSSSDDNTIKIWDLDSGKLLNTLVSYRIHSAVVSENKIISCEWNAIKIWNLNSGKLLKTIKVNDHVLSAFVSKGKIVSGLYNGNIKIRDFQTGKLLKTLYGHRDSVYALLVCKDKLISGCRDHTIKIWNFKSGKLLKTLKGHKGDVHSLFVSDGRIFSGSHDNTIRIWDFKDFNLLKTISLHSNDVNSVFVFNGKIVSGSRDKSILVTEVFFSDENRKEFAEKATAYFSNTIFEGDAYEEAKKLPLQNLGININNFARRHITHQLSKYKLRLRNSFKNGVIGERYVPYTSSSYTSHDYDYITIDGNMHNIGTSKRHSTSGGGYKADVFGYKAIYEVKNFSDQHYIIDLKSDWTGTYSDYLVKNYGAWDDNSGTYSTLKTKTSPSSYSESFILAPGKKFKYQFEVGEKEPSDLLTVPVKVAVIKKEFHNGLLTAMDDKNTDTKLIDKYLKNDLVKKWHPALEKRKKQIIQDREDMFSKENIAAVTIRLEYDKEDYDKDFNDNQITIVISSKKPLKVSYETPFKKGTVKVTKKAPGLHSHYEYRKTHQVGGIDKEGLSAKATYVWPTAAR